MCLRLQSACLPAQEERCVDEGGEEGEELEGEHLDCEAALLTSMGTHTLCRETERQSYEQTDRQMDSQTDRQTHRQTDMQSDGQSDRQMDRHKRGWIDRH